MTGALRDGVGFSGAFPHDSGERLLVFYGFELIEIVKNDSADPAFKLLLARLYNAKVKLSALCNPLLRQIVVQATDEKGRTIRVAILSAIP